MSWNDSIKRIEFKAKHEKQADEYRKLGMSEEQIQAMYEYDYEQYKSERRYRKHNQSMEPADFSSADDDIEKTPLFTKFAETLTITDDNAPSHSRYWWVEEIGTPALAEKLKRLSENDLELLTLIAFDGYTQADIAEWQGISKQAVSKKICRIKKLLR
ncbi:MAG: sigma factor-like helix-turn-helix DNA-binding protein [Eubacteriales bacterium]|nr:sigma factor-like helix-turn-helix DNA-binding protein [Eubacteriales bacterium]